MIEEAELARISNMMVDSFEDYLMYLRNINFKNSMEILQEQLIEIEIF